MEDSDAKPHPEEGREHSLALDKPTLNPRGGRLRFLNNHQGRPLGVALGLYGQACKQPATDSRTGGA